VPGSAGRRTPSTDRWRKWRHSTIRLGDLGPKHLAETLYMSGDGQAEFLIFAQVGAALGALCLLPVVVGRLVRLARGEGRHTYTESDAIAHLDFTAPSFERIRVRSLEREAIQSRVARRRASAVRELREIGYQESVTTMLVAVLDPNDAVRSEAAEGIVAIADPDAVEPLVHAVATRSRQAGSAREAIIGLGETAIPELRRIGQESPEPRMRRTAANLEGRLAAGTRDRVAS